MYLLLFAGASTGLAATCFALAGHPALGQHMLKPIHKQLAGLLCLLALACSALAWAALYGWEWGLPFTLAWAMIHGLGQSLLLHFRPNWLLPMLGLYVSGSAIGIGGALL
ncbi:MAG: DUF3325 family protein [Cellvibrionaceae bacterium]|nr:DUF3325 family protein [Cellvibrionaceae bacterium]